MEKTLIPLTKLPSKMGKVADVINNIIDHIKNGCESKIETINDFKFTLPLIKDDTNKVIQIDENGDYTEVLSSITIYQNGEITDPASMVESSTGKFGYESKPYENAWAWVRHNSHAYVGVWNSEYSCLDLKQLNDDDYNIYADGTSAIDDICDVNNEHKNVFMKLPTFWYFDEIDGNGNLIFYIANHYVEGWNEWDERSLIGVYEAVKDDEDMIRSISNKPSDTGFGYDNYKDMSRANNNYTDISEEGFSLVTFQQHSIMAYLFYGYYGNLDSQAICGAGTNNKNKPTGITNGLGMKDTNIINGNGTTDAEYNWRNIKFWGLENWWGDNYEYIDNLRMISTDTCAILDYNGDEIDKYTFNTSYPSDGIIMSINGCGKGYAFFDLLNNNYPIHEGYTDVGEYYFENEEIAVRSGGTNNDQGAGISALSLGHPKNSANYSFGTRLAYHGPIRIV